MINGIFNFLNSPAMIATAQNTKAAVTIETGLKAAGRPAFTMMDKNVDEKTRRYSAAKELLYQSLCLGIYLALIIPVFKKGTFGIFKKIFKNEKDFQMFKNASEYLDYHKLATFADKGSRNLDKAEKLIAKADKVKDVQKAQELRAKAAELQKNGKKMREDEINKLPETLQAELKKPEVPKYIMAKGAIEFSSLIGSVIGLTILAPELSHLVLHPIMKALGMEKKPDAKSTEEQQKLDQKA